MSRTMQEDGDTNLFHSCFVVEAEEISKTLTRVSFPSGKTHTEV